ncbi:RNA polymerase [Streptomyces venezuelae]|uniref:RNA polymerase sigma factor n=1 Tax=Streptomyces venezuelae TaxID=54571 RepID=A0A5P2CVA2_STRVZ|nr:sigma-70 family RNA polymerase sigma factor [Streptomyces venezuelae]QES46836.1 RNA polymerase [Streptomyces venezuelae]
MSTEHGTAALTALVAAAREGDPRAQDELVSTHLPLVYNIVGRALGGSCDVDDVVQDTMLRALDGLGGLRAPESFRSWLVAITMNRVRAHWREREFGPSGLEGTEELADPGADFVDLTVVRLQLAGQRQETARATRWLEPDDRGLLSLWWLECAGELTRPEVAEALGLSPQHTAVRVQRMKAQLEAARVVVRTLDAVPPCPDLRPMLSAWDGRPSALWRKRIARHARDCVRCAGLWNGLVPAEGLLAGLALVPVSMALLSGVRSAAAGFAPAGTASYADPGTAAYSDPDAVGYADPNTLAYADPAAAGYAGPDTVAYGATPEAGYAVTGSPAGGHGTAEAGRHRAGDGRDGVRSTARKRRQNRRRAVGAAVVAACMASGGIWYLGTGPGDGEDEAASRTPASPLAVLTAPDASPSAASPSGSAAASPSASASASASPSTGTSASAQAGASGSPSASKTAGPAKTSAKAAPRPSSPLPAPPAPQGDAAQVVALVNKERAAAGCGPLKDDPQLRAAAQGHSDDMAARDFFSHTAPGGSDPGDRTTAAGYRWSTYGENIAKGQQTPEQVMDSWMNSSGHRANILNCSFKDIGVGIRKGSGGPWWTQNFGARM